MRMKKGRPKKKADRRRDNRFSMKTSDAEKELGQSVADDLYDGNMSLWARMALNEAARRHHDSK